MNYYHKDMEKELKLTSFDNKQWIFYCKSQGLEIRYSIDTVNFLLRNEILVRSEINSII
jgi:hypothetical protein